MIPVGLKGNGIKYFAFSVAAITLLLVWGLETPHGLLGKADAVGYAVCHRIDLRSFHIGFRQLPLCARCTGQYLGAMIGLLFQGFVAKKRSGFPTRGIYIIIAVMGFAYVVDGLNSYLSLPPIPVIFPWVPHLYEPSNMLRLFTGTGMGIALAVILYPAFMGSVYTEPDPRPAIGGVKPLAGLISLCFTFDLLILAGSPNILLPAALISVCGVIALLSLAYTIVILRIFKRENSYTRLSQVLLPMGMGFLVAMSQVGLFDVIRFIITGTWSGLSLG